ncbi:hypothetical protein ScPMuIL_000746 [Solemya velum]
MQQRSDFVPWIWQRNREVGHVKTKTLKPPSLDYNRVANGALYSYIKAVHTWEPTKTVEHTHHGGIFNFDFAPDGSILVAACERESFLIFDPLNGRLVGYKNKAHNDCVNCIRFLDNRLFATCSDDTTIALWDARFLKHKIRTLQGHSNWVKNVEYAPDQGLLVTSGFDGSIYTWNINSYSEVEHPNSLVFHTRGLMRSKLTADSKKLVMSTQAGYLIIIHDLDLSTLANDLKGFRPNMYRLMQISETSLGFGTMYNSVFTSSRNRVEIISDWPVGNEANVIASLQVHPQGWCALSRNTNADETSEWTCVHDIQGQRKFIDKHPRSPSGAGPLSPSTELSDSSESDIDSEFEDDIIDHSVAEGHTLNNNDTRNTAANTTGIANDSGAGNSIEDFLASDSESDIASGDEQITNAVMYLLNSNLHEGRSRQGKVHQNDPRLVAYAEEPNVGRGFIKELCFSTDGRLICSPFGFGVRPNGF